MAEFSTPPGSSSPDAGAHRPKRSWRYRLLRAALHLSVVAIVVATVPAWWCGRESGKSYDGDLESQQRLANGVARWVESDLDTASFTTGSDLFDGEWLFGTHMMAAMGFAQTAIERPQLADRHITLINRCIDRLLSKEVRQFDADAWSSDALDTLATDEGHAAYLGYFNLVLGMARLLDPASPHAAMHDRITATLVRRIERSPTMLLETYPHETYPVDNCAVIASIALHERATGNDHHTLIVAWMTKCRSTWIDHETGLLYQAMSPTDDKPYDDPRGSGTALGAYFLSFADPAIAADLHAAVKRELATSICGFGAVREYPSTVAGGAGDIDSGPVVLGLSISATGFSMANHRIHGDAVLYRQAYATAHLFGGPCDRDDHRNFVAGGPIGDAIMFAMLTALPRERLADWRRP